VAAPRDVLLDGHDGAQAEHPPQTADANSEHQHHQRPAAADAEGAVIDAQSEGRPVLTPAAPAFGDEAQRRAALVQAVVLERCELVHASQHEHGRADQPRVLGEPATLAHQCMQRRVEGVDGDAEHAPDAQIADQQQQHEAAVIRPPPGHRVEQANQRQTGRQHHRHHHQQPAEHEHGQHQRAATAVDLLVVEVPPVGRLAPQHEGQPRQTAESQQGGREHAPTLPCRHHERPTPRT
jgi:hypothetical protein